MRGSVRWLSYLERKQSMIVTVRADGSTIFLTSPVEETFLRSIISRDYEGEVDWTSIDFLHQGLEACAFTRFSVVEGSWISILRRFVRSGSLISPYET